MFSIHDPFARPMRKHLKTSVMGLGLVRLLQDAKRYDEARTTLETIEEGSRKTVTVRSPDKRCKTNRLKASVRTDAVSQRLSRPATDKPARCVLDHADVRVIG